MSRWMVLERLRGLGLAWAIPEVERRTHLAVMIRDEQARIALVAAWVAVQLTRGQRVAVLVKDQSEGRCLADTLERWLPSVHVWLGAREGVWNRSWKEIRAQEQVIVLTYYQFLNRVNRWPRWGFYALVLWRVDAWLQPGRLPVLDALLDVVARGRARLALCAVSPRLQSSWVAWLAQRFPFDELGVLRSNDVVAPRIRAFDVGGVEDGVSPLDLVESGCDVCLVVAESDVSSVAAYSAQVGGRVQIRSFGNEDEGSFRQVYLYVPRLELGDDELKRWAGRVAPGGTLSILYESETFEGRMQPEEVVADFRHRLCEMAGFARDGKEPVIDLPEFMVQFLRRVRFLNQLRQEIGETYLGARLGQRFVAECWKQLQELLASGSGLVERPQYALVQQDVVPRSSSAEEHDRAGDEPVAQESRRIVRSGWLRLTPLGREAAIQFRRLSLVAPVRSQSREWQTVDDLVAVLRTEACDSQAVKLLDHIMEKKRPPGSTTRLVDRGTVFRWRLLVAAFHTLHPHDKGLWRLERVLVPVDPQPTQRRYRGLNVMALLVPYLHALLVEGSVSDKPPRPGLMLPSRCHYVHYRDLAEWLGASPNTVYRLLRLYLPAPTPLDLERLKAHFARRGRRSLGIRLVHLLQELAPHVEHAYSRPPASGRPRRVLVRLVETLTGELGFPPGFVEGCRDCVAYAAHRRVCALAWHIVHQVGPAALPPSLHDRDRQCARRASPCDCFAPRRMPVLATLLERWAPLHEEILTGRLVVACPITRCPGRVLLEPLARAGQCDGCGCEVRLDNDDASHVWVSANRRGFLQKMIEVLTGVQSDFQRVAHQTRTQLEHPLALEPVADNLEVRQESLHWLVHISPSEVVERSRSATHTNLVLAPNHAVSFAARQQLRDSRVKVMAYPAANVIPRLTPNPAILSNLQWVGRNPLLLMKFGTSVVLTALATTAELVLLPKIDFSKVEACLQQQIDLFTDFLRRGQFSRLRWMGVEGRIARIQAELVREQVRMRSEKDSVTVRGRYLSRKVPMEGGFVRASQSPFDEALNEGHRQIGWILRAENAAAGLGYFTPGTLFFHERVTGKSLHLDLDETARRVIDNEVLALFLNRNLTIRDFTCDVDAFGFPAYRAKGTCVEVIHRAVDEVLRRSLRTSQEQRTLLSAHRLSVESLVGAAYSHDVGIYAPLVYLPSETLPRLLSELGPLADLAEHIHSRIELAHLANIPASVVKQALEMCEVMLR